MKLWQVCALISFWLGTVASFPYVDIDDNGGTFVIWMLITLFMTIFTLFSTLGYLQRNNIIVFEGD